MFGPTAVATELLLLLLLLLLPTPCESVCHELTLWLQSISLGILVCVTAVGGVTRGTADVLVIYKKYDRLLTKPGVCFTCGPWSGSSLEIVLVWSLLTCVKQTTATRTLAVLLSELKERLHGTEPLCVRLSLAEKAFLAPLKAAVAQKEDVVILWLANLLTKKAVALTTEEQLAAWTTLSTILSSQRLKALCSINWVCPITSSFTEVCLQACQSLMRAWCNFLTCEVLFLLPKSCLMSQ
ncbi:hypothetical protein E2C01_061323 [Portunus trituberculatus]|uniref:Uncharacterized protein n=1 Tax=Portunus trituberculatus TaxID=210409 RepID=A0A5B7HCV7_PORTR|nr:hypothetical protein [Portunus trituberculatus]